MKYYNPKYVAAGHISCTITVKIEYANFKVIKKCKSKIIIQQIASLHEFTFNAYLQLIQVVELKYVFQNIAELLKY